MWGIEKSVVIIHHKAKYKGGSERGRGRINGKQVCVIKDCSSEITMLHQYLIDGENLMLNCDLRVFTYYFCFMIVYKDTYGNEFLLQ